MTRSNRDLIAQQEQIANYSAIAQRTQLEYTQKGKLVGALAEAGKTLPQPQSANFQNTLFNAGVREEGIEYYKQFSQGFVEQAQQTPFVLPQFSSPYDSRSNYNAAGVVDPSELAPNPNILGRSQAGSLDLTPRSNIILQPQSVILDPTNLKPNAQGVLDFTPSAGITGQASGLGKLIDVPRFNTESYDRYQEDARSRYAEYVASPIKIEVSPQVQQQVQNRAGQREANGVQLPPVKPIVVNLQMTNNVTNHVQDATETKETMTSGALQSIEDVLRLVEQKYK